MTDAERKALIEAGTHEYALQAVAQRLSAHLGRPVETADVVAGVDEVVAEVNALGERLNWATWRERLATKGGHS